MENIYYITPLDENYVQIIVPSFPGKEKNILNVIH